MNVISVNIKPQIRIIQENIKKFKHEGVRCECRYECDKCEWKIHLTNHIKSKHEGVRYECDQCEYKTTLQSYLIYNKQSKHEEVRYACDQCELIFNPPKIYL